jgi:hypothetical protein
VTSDEDSARIQAVWQMLLHLLTVRGESTDIAVTISAAMALKECVDVSVQPFARFTDPLAHKVPFSFGNWTFPFSSLT